ncbi:hypothetical protein ACQEU8_07370 [Streptomyces sp. CA-250714]
MVLVVLVDPLLLRALAVLRVLVVLVVLMPLAVPATSGGAQDRRCCCGRW